MSESTRTTQQEYLEALSRHPERGHISTVRVTNNRAVQLDFLMEPLGDEGDPIQPGMSYDVVVQAPASGYVLDIDIAEDHVRVWFISSAGTYGKAFHKGISVAPYDLREQPS